MNQELVTYIVLGSESRLKNIKLPSANKYEEYLLANFSSNASYQNQLDDLVTRSKGEVVVFLPPSSFPNIEAKEALKKIALIGLLKNERSELTFIFLYPSLEAYSFHHVLLELFQL
ncbi:hypothetical protein N9A14_04745 [Gammaproteobacteria bacterium]|nr:hypothetical protein [Gammaproteobacteria bacterium]